MKNFPNQANDVVRLRATLETFRALAADGADTDNDGVVGDELARLGHYTFRGFDYSANNLDARLAERIAEEHLKPRGSQGSRTNAREMRRTLRSLGWLNSDGTVTEDGDRLLTANPGSQEERALLAQALWGLAIGDSESGISHPAQIVLRLLNDAPSYRREGLELALEARNDSEAEFGRVLELYRLTQEERQARLRSGGVSDTQIANARKIFPALVRTAGLAVENGHHQLELSPDGQALIDAEPNSVDPYTIVNRNSTRRRTRGRFHRITAATAAQQTGNAQRAVLSEEQQERASRQLADRTDAHQEIVRQVARQINATGELYEDTYSFDLLFVPDDDTVPLLLFEIKTIVDDADEQVRRAVAQLSWYHYFEVSPVWPDRAVIEVLAVDDALRPGLRGYLASEDVAVIHVGDNGATRLITPDYPQVGHSLGLD